VTVVQIARHVLADDDVRGEGAVQELVPEVLQERPDRALHHPQVRERLGGEAQVGQRPPGVGVGRPDQDDDGDGCDGREGEDALHGHRMGILGVHREPSQRQEMGESSADVSAGAQPREAIARDIAAEALRHLEWLRSAGARELPIATAHPMEPLDPPGGFPEAGSAAAAAAEPAQGERQPDDVGPRDAQPQDVVPPASGRGGTDAPSKLALRQAQGERAASPALGQKGCGSPALAAVREGLGECTRCKLAKGRHHLVFGVGDPQAELVFVGEGPGEDEDLQGEPFVGRAGQLLTKMIEAMGYARGDVYIANVVKCRPPGNRNPEPDEIEACEPFLRAQLAAIRPKVIVALGKFAAQTLLRDGTAISRLRGRWFTYEGVKLMPTFHPAYLLRSPDEKKKAWDDLQLVMKELGKSSPRR